MGLPRITVITPTLNRAATLERTIASVADQDYPDLEYLVVDGGSTDGSLFIVSEYDRQVTWWRSGTDEGPADAVNRALERATGDIVAVLPDDDLYFPGALHDVAARFKEPDAPHWVVGNCRVIDQRDQPVGVAYAAAPLSLHGFLTSDSGRIPSVGTFYHRRVFDRLGAFAHDMPYAFGYEMAARLLAADVWPQMLGSVVAARREWAGGRSAEDLLQLGREYVAAAERHGDALPPMERLELWKSCAERRRVYRLAEMQMAESPQRRRMWQRLLRRPSWLADDLYRNVLLSDPAGAERRRAA